MADALPLSLRVPIDPVEAERTIVRFLRDYVAGSRRRGFVLGLSGGVDSAVSAALAVRAVGADRVHPYLLPEDATPTMDLEDAAAVAKHLGLRPQTLSIQPFVDALTPSLKDPERALVANAKARFRMVLLYAEAQRRDALVLGTGNKSELLMTYFTKWGDGGVDLQPLGDLYKTQVRALADHFQLPERVRTKPPTAGLWAGQTDEQELGITYEKLDRILLGLELHLPQDRIAATVGVEASEVDRIERTRALGQHKRRMPLVPKIGLRTIGLDWRTATLEA